MTFIVMIIASLITMQIMKNMILQQQYAASRFRAQQAMEWIALGKLRIAEQLTRDAGYKGEVLPLESSTVDELSPDAFPTIVITRQSQGSDAGEIDLNCWDIKVLRTSNQEKAIAIWQGELKE